MGLMEQLTERIESRTPSLAIRAIQPTFNWETAVGYLTHCADNKVGEPIAILEYKLPVADQIDSISPVKEYLSENFKYEIQGVDMYLTFTTLNDISYTSANDVLIWNVIGESHLTIDEEEKDVEAGDLIYIPKNKEYKYKSKSARVYVVFALRREDDN